MSFHLENVWWKDAGPVSIFLFWFDPDISHVSQIYIPPLAPGALLVDPATLRFSSCTAYKNLAFLLGLKRSSQRRPFSRVTSGWHEAAAAAPGGDLAVRGGAAGQPASLSCFAQGF